MPRDCLRIIESKSKVRNYTQQTRCFAKVSASTSTPGISFEVAELKEMVKALLLDKKNQSPALTPVKAVEQISLRSSLIDPNPKGCSTSCLSSSRLSSSSSSNSSVSKEDFHSYVRKANDAVMRTCKLKVKHCKTIDQSTDKLSKFFASNTASTFGTLPSNTLLTRKRLKGITTRSGVAYKGPTIPITSSPKVMERDTEVTKDTMPPTNNGSTEDIPPPVVPIVHHESI
ncbi:hypothetical protein Tco_0289661 [Tanacetum coccineum]